MEEYIHLVNKYPWADFTVPSEYLAGHPPQGEVLVRQDLADGAFDGSYSWAEKCSSLRIWTILEQSRLASCRAEALARRSGFDLKPQLWEGMDSSFFKRLVGLTTTHFGMSTPVINEERQARAFSILGDSLRIAREAELAVAEQLVTQTASLKRDAIYEFEIFPTPPDRDLPPQPSRTAIRLPLILPQGVTSIDLQENGNPIPVSLTDHFPLPDGRLSCELRFVVQLDPSRVKGYHIFPYHHDSPAHSVTYLRNKWLEVEFSDQVGIKSLKHNGKKIEGWDFLQPFVSYRKWKKAVIYPVTQWEFIPLTGEHWERLHRVRMRASIPMQTIHGEFINEFTYTFTLFDELPYLYVDVQARYAHTPSTETIHNLTQKLRRRMDLRWVEVAPFQLHPSLNPAVGRPLRIWKHNYLGITAYYDLDYARINPRNRNLDSFNHQVTAGWVAVTDGKRGLLLGENAASLASMAFCPMRLREQHGIQQLWLNPFGSYYGKLASYSHLGATGLGAEFLKAFSGFLKPNGPSYNGQTLHFSLLLAPYTGDEPPTELQADAGAHFYPPAILFHASPDDIDVLLPSDISSIIENEKRTAAIAAIELIPSPPPSLPILLIPRLTWFGIPLGMYPFPVMKLPGASHGA